MNSSHPKVSPIDVQAFSPERTNVLGVGVSVIDMQDALRLSENLIENDGNGYICVTGVHGVIEAQTDSTFRDTLNRSFLTVPDGTPMVWIGWLRGRRRMRRVYGPDFMMNLCRLSAVKGYRVFLYGGGPGVATALSHELTERCKGLQVVGTYTPPFRPLNEVEERQVAKLVAESKPDILWVGLSTPKQERFMAQYLPKLDVKLMVGVGAAFDIHTGSVKDAPDLVKLLGLQWLHRLLQEPRRLWRRYLVNNPIFLWNISLQFLGWRKFYMD